MCKSKEVEQTLPYINLANCAAVTVAANGIGLHFGAKGVQLQSEESSVTINDNPYLTGTVVVRQGISTAIRGVSDLAPSMSITIQQDASLNYEGQTYVEGLYTLEVDGTMHLVGDSAASAAAASPADLD